LARPFPNELKRSGGRSGGAVPLPEAGCRQHSKRQRGRHPKREHLSGTGSVRPEKEKKKGKIRKRESFRQHSLT